MAERDNRGRFVKGNTASPGRPKLPDEFKTRAKKYADEALDKLAEIMRDATAKHSDVIRACELLLERGYGNVAPASEENGKKNEAIVVRFENAGPEEWNE